MGGAVFVGDIANGEEYLNPSLDRMMTFGFRDDDDEGSLCCSYVL